MNIIECFELAIKTIFSRKMRSFLTMLGIIIGVMSVILIVGLGNGMQKYMVDTFESVGVSNLTVTITGRGSSRSVSADDMYEIVANNQEYLALVTPTVGMYTTVKIGNETLDSTSVTGVGEDHLTISSYDIARGRNISYIDILNRHKVCVVGSYINDIWYRGDAVGQTIRIGGHSFTIIGVLDLIDDGDENGVDDCVYLPYSTAARVSGTAISSYTISVTSEDTVDESRRVVEDELFRVFGNSDAYRVISLSQLLDIMTDMLNVFIVILTAIAAISLLVGGIGIMNIMLVSVTERTKEIGIRKALGAKERYILTQFVAEAATTSAIGGILGIAAGFGMSSIATSLIRTLLEEDMAVTPSFGAILVAFGVSAAIGIMFGFLPARKAASLNPIEALYFE